MRSSKSRSRSKPNRPRTLGNITNRVFDSSGPEGKVRGTPQQIIEKYQQLGRDAQLSNDRVAAENFSQHAEHYTRMLAEANRELAAEQEQRQQYQNQNPQSGGNGGQQNGQQGNRDRQPDRDYRNDRSEYRGDQRGSDQPDIDAYPSNSDGFSAATYDDNGLVELPEAVRQQPRRDDNRRDDRPRDQRPAENRNDDNRRDENRSDDRPRDARPDQNRSDTPRNDQPRRDQPRRDNRPRFEGPRPDQPRPDQPRNDPPREPQPVVQVAATQSSPSVVVTVPITAEQPAAPKPVRAPRARKPAVKVDAADVGEGSAE